MDCERNAVRRFLGKLRRDHPHLRFIVNEDALSSNAPHYQMSITLSGWRQLYCPVFLPYFSLVSHTVHALFLRFRSFGNCHLALDIIVVGQGLLEP